jgi:4-hydroxy-2-oxoheptanedioate aldolase
MTELTAHSLWQEDKPAFGGWLTIDSPLILEGLVNAGSDYVGIDCQHTMFDENAAARLLRPLVGTETAVLVRVAANDPARIGLVLDAGADGVIVPMVDTPAEAEAAVSACRYGPRGVRSFGPQHGGLGATPAEIEARAMCFVMIETAGAMEELEGICSVEGVTGTYVGPADLAIALGIENPFASPRPEALDKAIAEVAAASARAGIVPGIHAISAAGAVESAAGGYRLISLRADFIQFADGVKRDLETARGAAAAAASGRLYH